MNLIDIGQMAHRSLVRNQMASYLPFDGADASTTFPEITGKTFTAAGNAQIDTAQSKFGGASLLLDGTGDWVASADHADFELGSGDFTIRKWARWAVLPTSGNYQTLEAKWRSVNNRSFDFFLLNTAGVYSLNFTWSTGGVSAAGNVAVNWTPSTGVWYAIQVIRSGSTLKFSVDGAQVGTDQAISGAFFDGNAELGIGSDGTGSVNGWIDDELVLKGATIEASDYLTMPFPRF